MNLKNITLIFALCSASLFSQEKKWTLQESVNYAIKNNISVKNAELNIKDTDVNRKDAIGSFLPTVNASASHSWNIGLNQNITTGLLENQTTQFTSASLSANVTIFNGLQNQNRLRRANLNIISQQYQLLQMQEDIALNVANAYLQILFNKENLKVIIQQVIFDEDQVTRTGNLVDAGSVPKGDLLDVKATLATDKQRKIAAENALLISKLSLAQLLRLEDFSTFDIADDNFEILESLVLREDYQAIISKAKENRTELKVAQSNVELAQKDIQIARGVYMPTLTGFYSFSTRASNTGRVIGFEQNANNPTTIIGLVEGTNQNVVRPNTSLLLGNPLPIFDQFDDNKGQNFGLQLNVPIFNGFRTRNNVTRAKIALDRATLNLDQKNLDIERNVFTAYTDTKASKESYEASLTALEARKQSFQYAKERYDVGLINVFDFNQVQNLLNNAQSEVLRTKYDYIFRTKILEFYFGIPLIQKQ